MHRRLPLFALLLLVGSFALPHLVHASIPFLPPDQTIIPTADNQCAAGWGMVIVVINNIIEFAITMMLIFVMPILIAYSGFLFVVNPVNSGGIAQAKSILTNSIVGLVVVLAAWLIVDAVMAALYNPNATSVTKNWVDLVTLGGAPQCIKSVGDLNALNQANLQGGSEVTGVSADGGKFLTLPTNGACTADNLKTAAQQANVSLTQAQADTLSCIAVAESTCGTNTSVAKQANGKPTTANGMFQIILGLNDTCHNLNIPACTAAAQAAGYKSITGNLNCSTAFSDGLPKANMPNLAAACKVAAASLPCNTAAAACLIQSKGGKYTDWTGSGDGFKHATQKNCVTQYAGK